MDNNVAPIGKPVHTHHFRIQPTHGWAAINLGEMWSFRDLFLMLALRDVKLRYKQTALGIVWVILQPLVTAIVFAAIFGRLAHLPSEGAPYVLFVFAGMLPWNFLQSSLQRAGNSLVSDARLITKVYFPRMIIPIASTAAVLVDFLVAFAVMVCLILLYRMPLTWRLLTVPLLLLIVFLISVGMSLWLSALNVYYRDFMYAMPFLIQTWMYGSPLVYSSSMIPDKWMMLYALNPLTGVIDGFRWALLARSTFPWLTVSLAVAMACLLFFGGALVFRRVERHFADIV